MKTEEIEKLNLQKGDCFLVKYSYQKNNEFTVAQISNDSDFCYKTDRNEYWFKTSNSEAFEINTQNSSVVKKDTRSIHSSFIIGKIDKTDFEKIKKSWLLSNAAIASILLEI